MNQINESENMDAMASVITEDEMLKNPAIMQVMDTINILDFESFLEEIKVSNGKVMSWSAEGVKNFALIFKVSVGPITIEKVEDEGLLLQAQGHSKILGISAPALVFQPYEKKKAGKKEETEADDHWSSRGAARLIRNARKYLLPLDMLRDRLYQAQDAKNDFGNLMKDVAEEWDDVAKEISPLTKRDCLKAAEDQYGAKEVWDDTMWNQFITDLQNHTTNYLNDYRDKAIDQQNTNESLNTEEDNTEEV